MRQDLPKIPRSEYEVRWERVQQVMQEANLDLILAYADDRATYGAAYGRYYADLPVHFEDVLVMFIRGQAPKLLVGPETIGYAEHVSTIREILVLAEFTHEDEDYPFSAVTPLREIVSGSIGDGPMRIGLAAKVHMGADLYEAIRAAFPEGEFVGADKLLEPMRGVKSQAELEVIRYAYHLANLGMNAAVSAIRPGVTEREVAAEAEYAMRKAGSEGCGIDTIVASGPNNRHVLARTTTRQIEENDVVVVTVAPRYEGYHGACARTIVVGEPGEAFLKALEAEIRAQTLCGENLAPGRVGSEVEAMGREIMTQAGYGSNFLYSGLHSIGVIEFEPPILGPSSSAALEENMVVSVDIPLFEADIPGSRTEDGYLVTPGGPQRLTTAPWLIRK